MPFSDKERPPKFRSELVALIIFFAIAGLVVYQSYHDSSREIKILLQSQGNQTASSVSPSRLEREITEEIYSGGELLSHDYDLIADNYGRMTLPDEIVAFEHKPTEIYLWHIVEYLKMIGKVWGEKETTLILYDDRYAGRRYNALSLPAGTMFVGVSLILSARSEAELAVFLSHERAHVVLRHSAMMRKILKNFTLLEHKFAKKGEVEKQTALLRLKLKILGYGNVLGDLGNTLESEADFYGQEMLRQRGYNDFASSDFLFRFINLHYESYSPASFAAMKSRAEEMLKRANNFKTATGYVGKEFIVSNAKDFKLTQKKLSEHLQKQE